ncbi:hypothetical protein MLD38_006516 [Melastoma candidum]|uniref:Uncharacterized protein n=1 Tax=Melastoma candidum TaxID=119954 RepID=A0ACB9RMC9_9MYRT|nr:hypothetical protein MLD38_006516 [Melastoma candidum]
MPSPLLGLSTSDAHKLSIEKSKYLGGDVEHTHLVKVLDYALLNKVRSEMVKKPDAGDDADGKTSHIDIRKTMLTFRTATAKSIYQWMVKPQAIMKTNEMFLPGRMSFIFNMESGYSNDIPTTLHRSKGDCSVPECRWFCIGSVAKIMSYLRLGSSGKVLKQKKNEKESKVKNSLLANGLEEHKSVPENSVLRSQAESVRVVQPPPPLRKKQNELEKPVPAVVRVDDDDIFVGEGVEYSVPGKDANGSPLSEDMEESPQNKEKVSYFAEPVYGPIPPSVPQEWQDVNGYDAMHGQVLAAAAAATAYPGGWQDYQYAEQLAYQERYFQPNMPPFDGQAGVMPQDPRLMTQEEKDRGLGSVFKRDDQRLQQRREKDAREKDPNFISEIYSECYPGYQEYNREIVDSETRMIYPRWIWAERRNVGFTVGTLRRRRNGRNTTSRRKPCRRQRSSSA